MYARHTGNMWTYLEVKMSKVEFTGPINTVTDNAPYAGWGNYNFLKISLLFLLLVTTRTSQNVRNVC